MVKLISLILLFPFIGRAQEHYNWTEVENVKFYDLNTICDTDSIPAGSKAVTDKTANWQKLLSGTHDEPKDIAVENTCYFIVVKFKNGNSIQFRLFPQQMAIFDTRKSHFNYTFFNESDKPILNRLILDCRRCSQDPKCESIN